MKFVHKEKKSTLGYAKSCLLVLLTAVSVLAVAGCAATSKGVDVQAASGDTTASARESVPAGLYDVRRGPNYTDRVVLTYDDCPNSREQLLVTVQAAQAANIGLVLAPTGACLESMGADIVDIMREHEQYVINHSATHSDLSTLSQSGVERELGAPGVVTNYGRPPYGSGYDVPAVQDAYAAVGMKPWLWTVDTNDWKGLTAPAIASYVAANAKQGDTVLMHMQHQAFSPEAVLDIQQKLQVRGLEVCRAHPGTSPRDLPDSLPC